MIGRHLRTERRTGDNAIRKSKEVHPGSIERQRVDNPCRDAVSDALAWGIELCTTGRASRTGQRSNDDEQGEDSHAVDE